jgi:hypothetical protein
MHVRVYRNTFHAADCMRKFTYMDIFSIMDESYFQNSACHNALIMRVDVVALLVHWF